MFGIINNNIFQIHFKEKRGQQDLSFVIHKYFIILLYLFYTFGGLGERLKPAVC